MSIEPRMSLAYDRTGVVACNTTRQARLVIKQLKAAKAAFVLYKKQVMDQQRVIRAQYTREVRHRGSKLRGWGWIGTIVRNFQTADRDETRAELADQLEPWERERERIETQIHAVDADINRLQAEYRI